MLHEFTLAQKSLVGTHVYLRSNSHAVLYNINACICSVNSALQLLHNMLEMLDVGEDVESGLPTSGELSLPDGWPSTTICLLGALPSPHWENLHTLFTGDICQAKEWKTR